MRLSILALCAATLLGTAAVAMAAIKPDTAIHYRQSVYTMINWNFSPMGDMVKGKTPWNAAEFSRHADRIAALTPQLMEGFPAGSGQGAKTEAKPDIWKNPDDFKSKMDDLVKQSQALAEVSRTGDEAKTKEQFKATARACKSCHDKYREKD